MVARTRNSPASQRFWRKAFRKALGALIAKHDGRMGPAGVAQLAREHADASLAEYQRRWGRK